MAEEARLIAEQEEQERLERERKEEEERERLELKVRSFLKGFFAIADYNRPLN